MPTTVTSPEAIRTGVTILAVPPDAVKRFGRLIATVSADKLPGDARLDFLTIDLQRSLDGVQWESLASFTRSGKPKPTPTIVSTWRTNRDGYELPVEGDVRVVITARAAYRSALALERLDAVEPPPPRETHQSVAHDGEANATGTAVQATSISVNKTTAGDNRAAVASVRWAAVDGTISTITYGGVGMTLGNDGTNNASVATASGFLVTARLYHKVAPATGSTAVVVNFDSECVGALAVSSYTGVHQTTLVKAGSVATSTAAASLTVNGTAAGDMAVDGLAVEDPDTIPPTVAGGMTSIQSAEVSGVPYGFSASYEASVGASVAVSWTVGGFGGLAYVAMALAQATVPTAAITGTATASITEADVVAGGKTIIITLTDDTWIAA